MDTNKMIGGQPDLKSKSPSDTSFYKKLSHASGEVEQVQGYYRDEIARVLPTVQFGVGTQINEKPSMNNIDMLNLPGKAKSDGLFECKCYVLDKSTNTSIEKPFLLMLEAKLDVDFSDLDERAKVLLQAICYLKLILTKGVESPVDGFVHKQLPAVIVLGSKINCGAIPTSVISRLWQLDKLYIEGINSPSTAWDPKNNNAGILDILKNNEEINKAFILRDVENGLYDLCSDILHMATDTEVTEDVSEKNITKAYQRFDIYVLHKKIKDGIQEDIPMDIKRKAFLSLLIADDDKVNFVEARSARGETKQKEIIKIDFSGSILEVNRRQFQTFKVLYSLREYTPREKEIITAVADRLIKEDSRRFKGDYYTPDIWVDEAYKLLDKHLGTDWRNHYLVWDCAWGTGNLTRSQFDFGTDRNLYCSTLRPEDIEIANDAGYNPNATKFQYDFLNDDIELFESLERIMWEPFRDTSFYHKSDVKQFVKLTSIEDLYELAVEKGVIEPEAVTEAWKNIVTRVKMTKLYQQAPNLINGLLGWNEKKERKKLLFILNPPYGTSKNNTTGANNSKAGIAKTSIRDEMESDNLGMAQRQLYTQFLYRTYKLIEELSGNGVIGAFTQSDFLTTISYDKFRNWYYNKIAYEDGFLFSGGHFSNVSPAIGISFTLWNTEGNKENKTILQVLDIDENN